MKESEFCREACEKGSHDQLRGLLDSLESRFCTLSVSCSDSSSSIIIKINRTVCKMTRSKLQLGLRLRQLFYILEPVKEVEALRVQKGSAGLDVPPRDNVLDGQLDLLAIHRDLYQEYPVC